MKRFQAIHWHRSMGIMLVLVFLMIGGSFIAARQVDKIEEGKSFQSLQGETQNLADNIEETVERDQDLLELIAFLIAGYDDLSSPHLWNMLESYTSMGLISRLELLLPGDILLTDGGETVDVSGYLSFEEEMVQGIHMGRREKDFLREGGYILRHYVPVYKDDAVMAMLCGVIELSRLPQKLQAQAYGDEAAMYIIEGKTGNFIVDTWHESPGNVWDLGERQMAEGYTPDQLREGLINGTRGFVAFVSQTTGEYLYFNYQPVAVNDWRVALSVPEDAVFADANRMRGIMNIFLIFELGCFVVYFAGMIGYVVYETGKKQRQLDMLHNIYEIEKLLFNAHEKQENITAALEKLAHTSMARETGLWFQKPRYGDAFFSWSKNGEKKPEDHGESMHHLMDYFQKGSTYFESCRKDKLCSFLRWNEEVKNFAAVPLERLDGSVCGILYACNISARHISQALLKSVSVSFSMLLRNIKSFDDMKERGERDMLSGLNNRNRYETDLPGYIKRYHTSLACVYMDVNGLHELNNTCGHDAGDQMIRSVAEKLKHWFDAEAIYRIGGDEFVVFAPDVPKDELMVRIKAMEDALEKEDIHISAGIAWMEHVEHMDVLIKAAEQEMYEAKRKFYENEKYDRRRSRR